ncbi:MTA/SAH nucleosidase [Mucilaginibacter paludis DSM 18603]|uniref:adenosylhomocysteine nucleosidase n=2 Tax=Mucilaginibacter TaxID=423349 RepID=H1YAC9_9SPHI|nr:MTA/SAH nucleosidase [Mucilaginibacter paludis DSM 18603]
MKIMARPLLIWFFCMVTGLASAQTVKSQPITGILGAFPAEVTLIHDLILDKKEMIFQHIRFTEGTLNGRHVVLASTGMGKVNAAITTTLMLEHFEPEELLFTGIAGGVNPGLSPGDLVIGNKIAYHDYGTITPDSMMRRGTRTQDNAEENPIYFPCNPKLVKVAQEVSGRLTLKKVGSGSRTPKIVTGIIVTGDVFVSSNEATKKLRLTMNAEATEMEGAAVAQTCWQQKTPFLVIRSLSDNASNNAKDDVAAFYQTAAHNSASLVMAVVGGLGM